MYGCIPGIRENRNTYKYCKVLSGFRWALQIPAFPENGGRKAVNGPTSSQPRNNVPGKLREKILKKYKSVRACHVKI
jgi:hypothetical protein